jgi:hypothetical protein
MSLRRIGKSAVSVYRTAFAGVAVVCLVLPAFTGCGAATPANDATAELQTTPDPVVPLAAAYEMQGQDRPVIFLDVSGTPGVTHEQVADALSSRLGVAVLPADVAFNGDADLPALTPVDPSTGNTGVKLSVLEMRQLDPMEYEVEVEFVRSGLDGGTLIFTLSFDGAEWRITQAVAGAQA